MNTKFRMIVFDVDGTLTTHPSVWQFIHEELGLWDDHAVQYQIRYREGKISYQEFCDYDARCWRGYSLDELLKLTDKIKYSEGVKETIPKLKAAGFVLAAISTGLTFFTDRICRDLLLDKVVANELALDSGRVTGKTIIHVDETGKGKVFDSLVSSYGISPRGVITVVDSRTDLPMAERSGYSIGFNCLDEKLAGVVDYNCRTKDFREVFSKIAEISGITPQ